MEANLFFAKLLIFNSEDLEICLNAEDKAPHLGWIDRPKTKQALLDGIFKFPCFDSEIIKTKFHQQQINISKSNIQDVGDEEKLIPPFSGSAFDETYVYWSFRCYN